MLLQKPSGDTQALEDINSIAIILGDPNDEVASYTKTTALQVCFRLLFWYALHVC